MIAWIVAPENRGKVVLITATLLMWLFLLFSFNHYGYEETWMFWKIPTFMPPFYDFRLIPGSAESFRHGFEPSVENPFEVGQRVFNYPAFWRLFFYTGITQADTIWIGIVMLVLFFGGVFLFPQELPVSGAIGMLLVLFSPAAVLLYERGNVDLIVFFLCVLIVLAAEYSAGLASGLIVFGAIIKMFPLFGVAVLLREPKKKFIRFVLTCLLLFLIYGALTFPSQSAAWNSTMRGDNQSYGSFVLITRFDAYLQQLFPNLFTTGQWKILFEALAVGLMGVAGVLALRADESLSEPVGRNLTAFRMGAAIYIGTFLLGNNWEYRLAFLVLVVPQLSSWGHVPGRRSRLIVWGTLVLVILSCWSWFLKIDFPLIPLKDPNQRNLVVDEVLNWLLVPGFTYLLFASTPSWLRDDLRRWVGFNRTISPAPDLLKS